MKNNCIFLLLTFLFFIPFSEVSAQLNSGHTIGGRFGSSQGITYRHTLQEDRALEGILSIQSNSRARRFRLIGLYQYHQPLSGDFYWYYGYGGSIGSYKQKNYTVVENGVTERREGVSEVALSIEGIIGVEYKVPESPLSISLDLKPYFDFIQDSNIRLIDPFGFSIRYHF